MSRTKTYEPVSYEVGVEKIWEYAQAVGEDSPLHRDREAARAAGFRDVVAPPMFCVVYSARALAPAILDPELGIDYARMVHGGQEFVWGEPVCAGDVVTSTASLLEVFEKRGMGFYVFETVSLNAEGAETVRGRWTDIVRAEGRS